MNGRFIRGLHWGCITWPDNEWLENVCVSDGLIEKMDDELPMTIQCPYKIVYDKKRRTLTLKE